MTNRKIRALVLAAILAGAGCGGGETPPPAAPPVAAVPAPDGAAPQPPAAAPDEGGGGGPVALEGVAEAERQFLLADKDPAVAVIAALFDDLGIDLEVTAGDLGPVVPTNVAEATDVDQDAPAGDDRPDAAEVAGVKVTSTRSAWFDARYLRDGNPNTAWAPGAEDDDRFVLVKFEDPTEVGAIALQVSPVGVVVDVEARGADGGFEPIARDLVPRYRELHWINLAKTTTTQLRLRFHGPEVLVSEVAVYGEEADEPTPAPTATPRPTAKPTVKPSPTPTPTPSTTPTPTPSATATPSPAATATPTPTPTATATPTPAATATPTPRPSTTPTPTPRPSATPTPTPRPSATPTPTPRPSATATPTPRPSGT